MDELGVIMLSKISQEVKTIDGFSHLWNLNDQKIFTGKL